MNNSAYMQHPLPVGVSSNRGSEEEDQGEFREAAGDSPLRRVLSLYVGSLLAAKATAVPPPAHLIRQSGAVKPPEYVEPDSDNSSGISC